MSSDEIQQLIDQTGSGGVLKLTPAKKEFQGPAVIRKPLTIEGQSCTLWAEKGPVLSIESDGVVLKSLNVEVTGPDDQEGDDACALQVTKGKSVSLEHVSIRGNVIGLAAEEGEWRYPRSLRLGRLQSNHSHNFTAKLVVPAPCKFHSEIAGLSVQPSSCAGGAVKLLLEVDALSPGTILRGVITIRTASLTRTINVNASTPVHATGTEAVGSGQDVYVPNDWQTLFTGDEAIAPNGGGNSPAASPPAPTGTPAASSVSVPPPPPKPGKNPQRPKSGPDVTIPDRLEPEARTAPTAPPPNVFAPSPPAAPTKPAPSDDDADVPSSAPVQSQRRRPGMGSSLFGTGESSESPQPSGVSPNSVVPPPPPKPPVSSVVPPPPPKSPGSSVVPPSPPKPPESSVVPPPPPKSPGSSVVPPSPPKQPESSVVPPPPPKQSGSDPVSTPVVPNAPANGDGTDASSSDSTSSKREKKSGLGGAFS